MAAQIKIDCTLTESQAFRLALFLTRCGFGDFRDKAASSTEAYEMRDAASLIEAALSRGIEAAG